MKNIYLFAFLFSTTLNFNAQTAFSWFPNDTLIQDIDPNIYTDVHIDQVNNTNDTLVLGMEVIYNDIPSSWDGMLCVYGICLGTIPAVGFTLPMNPIYDSTNGFVKLTVFPDGGTQAITFRARIYDENNPSDGDTCTFIINSVVSVKDNYSNNKISLFPNPTSEILNINSEQLFDKIIINDIYGRIIINNNINPSNNNKLNVGMLPSGVYLVRVYSNDEIISIKKININE
jgi:hypothetical protein